MKSIRRFWQELCLCLLASLFPPFIFKLENSTDRLTSNLFVFLIVLDIFLVFILLRRLWKQKWKKLFIKATRIVFTKVAKFLMKVFEKFFDFWQVKFKNDSNVLSGKTYISFELTDPEKFKRSSKKKYKWKQMKSDRERLGHLYRHMINGQIKSGKSAYSFDTPTEIKSRNSSEELENELFDLYISTRYDERVALDTEQIFDLKNRCEEIFDKVK